tara:strand:- start:75 stop:455 length:381 start_codon:yes stop_codon:yes gene_type:complete
MNTLEIIIKNGLSIRQIPKQTISLHEIRHHKENQEIVFHTLPNHCNYKPFKKKNGDNKNYIFDDATETIKRKFTKKITIPKNSGFWMCKQVKNTNSSIAWDIKKDNLASNLKESVNLFLKNNTNLK